MQYSFSQPHHIPSNITPAKMSIETGSCSLAVLSPVQTHRLQHGMKSRPYGMIFKEEISNPASDAPDLDFPSPANVHPISRAVDSH